MTKKVLFAMLLTMLLSCVDAWGGFCVKGDCLNGQGLYQWNNGSTFAGQFVNGIPDGEGTFLTPDKRKFNVVYKNGAPVQTTPYSEEEEAIKERHKEAERFNIIGFEFYKKKDYKSAIFYFNKAITKWPDNAEFHNNYKKAKEGK